MLAYSAFDPAKTLDAADRLLQVDPNNLRALTFEVYFRDQAADQATDPAASRLRWTRRPSTHRRPGCNDEADRHE